LPNELLDQDGANAYTHALLFLSQQHIQAFVNDKDIITVDFRHKKKRSPIQESHNQKS